MYGRVQGLDRLNFLFKLSSYPTFSIGELALFLTSVFRILQQTASGVVSMGNSYSRNEQDLEKFHDGRRMLSP